MMLVASVVAGGRGPWDGAVSGCGPRVDRVTTSDSTVASLAVHIS